MRLFPVPCCTAQLLCCPTGGLPTLHAPPREVGAGCYAISLQHDCGWSLQSHTSPSAPSHCLRSEPLITCFLLLTLPAGGGRCGVWQWAGPLLQARQRGKLTATALRPCGPMAPAKGCWLALVCCRRLAWPSAGIRESLPLERPCTPAPLPALAARRCAPPPFWRASPSPCQP